MATVRYTTINGEVIAEKRDGVRKFYVPDGLGSTVALLDNTQAKTDTFGYWPYGEESSRTGATPTPFQFVGSSGYFRDTTRRVYVRARDLDVAKGRWLTADPRGLQTDINLYRYARDAPSVRVDPSGAFVPPGWPGKLQADPQIPAVSAAAGPDLAPLGRPASLPAFPRPVLPPKSCPGKTLLGYGCYCGPDRNPFYGPGPLPFPVDQMDSCCLQHDSTYWVHRCVPLDLRPECIQADWALCICATRVNCGVSPDPTSCNWYRAKVIAAFCFPRRRIPFPL